LVAVLGGAVPGTIAKGESNPSIATRGGASPVTVEGGNFNEPDGRNEFPNGHADVMGVRGVQVTRAVFGRGWRWSESLKEPTGTSLCEVPHVAYIASGTLHVLDQDGAEGEFGPGSLVVFDPGHDAWTVGDEPCVFIDFREAVRIPSDRA
jgi:hypothetical protein